MIVLNNQKFFKKIFSLTFIALNLQSQANSDATPNPELTKKSQKKLEGICSKIPGQDKCKINTLLGTYPSIICTWLEILHTQSFEILHQLEIKNKNKLLLHGPTGNGKTQLAYTIAKLTDSSLIEMHGALINRHQNDLFSRVQAYLDQTNKSVIVFIDDIELFAKRNYSNNTPEDEIPLSLFIKELDKYKNNNRVFFLFATNEYKKLHPKFLNKFSQVNKAEIQNPDYDDRLEILTTSLKEINNNVINYGLKKINLSENDLTILAQKTEGLSIRQLLDIFSSTIMMQNPSQEKETSLDDVMLIVKNALKDNQ